MKKSFLALFLALGILGVSNAFAYDSAKLYSVVPSTFVASANINVPSLKVKQITIFNPSTIAQTVTIYENANAVSPTVKAVFNIPGVAGIYYPISNSNLDEYSSFDCPYFAVKTSTTTTPVRVNVLYRR